MSITLYGIKACDTMKKARTWLTDKGMAYQFHDYKKSGIDAAHLSHWCNALGWEKVLNRAGTTFKKLPDSDKVGIDQALGPPGQLARVGAQHLLLDRQNLGGIHRKAAQPQAQQQARHAHIARGLAADRHALALRPACGDDVGHQAQLVAAGPVEIGGVDEVDR